MNGFGNLFILLSVCSVVCLCTKNFQAVHILDPSSSPDYKYYASWNSDQWISWLRQRYIEEQYQRRDNSSDSEQLSSPVKNNSVFGTWANIIVVASQYELEDAYTSFSVPAYTDASKSDYFWSDYPFTVFVILRGVKEKQNTFNVHKCSEKKMFINARVDPDTYQPIELKTFFPKKVKNPGEKLRVPLMVCKPVTQVRGLLDEIFFTLGTKRQDEDTDLFNSGGGVTNNTESSFEID